MKMLLACRRALLAYIAVAIAIPAGTATWIMPTHAGLLLVLGILVSSTCGCVSLWVLVRSYRGMGSTRKPRMLLLALLPLATSNGIVVWALWPFLLRLFASTSQIVKEWRAVETCLLHSGGLFIAFQLTVTVLTTAVVCLLGEVTARWAHRKRYADNASRCLWGGFFVLCCLVGPAMTFGGLEMARRMGMMIFVTAYHESMLDKAPECLRPGIPSQCWWSTISSLPEPGCRDDQGYMFCVAWQDDGPFDLAMLGRTFRDYNMEFGRVLYAEELWLRCHGWDDIRRWDSDGSREVRVTFGPFCRILYNSLSHDATEGLPEKRYKLMQAPVLDRRSVLWGWQESGPRVSFTIPPEPDAWGMVPNTFVTAYDGPAILNGQE
ncbi:MAG: hypothetical protein JXL80_12600 [Planctomycetes bacterium]|nr:hypothetical protein [Planctomycetota bacterium]